MRIRPDAYERIIAHEKERGPLLIEGGLGAAHDRLDAAIARVGGSSARLIETAERTAAERDYWVRLFNRLDAAISHHEKGKPATFVDEVDEALYFARRRVLSDAAKGARVDGS